MGQMGLLSRTWLATICWHTPRTPALVSRELGDSRRALACPGVVMCLAGPSRSSEVARRAGVTPCHEPTLSVPSGMAGTGGGVSQTPVGYGLAGSSGRQPEPGAGARGRSTAAGPGGGTTLGEGHGWRHRLYSPSETGAHRCHRFLRTPRPHSQSLGAVLGFPRCPIRPRESACCCRVPRGYAMACAGG
jgi:hypothetical protein